MGNSTSTIPMDSAHPISTPSGGSKTNAYADGKAPIFDQAMTAGDGPKFKSTLDRDEEASTSSKSFASRKI